jgi:hypothetical protein
LSSVLAEITTTKTDRRKVRLPGCTLRLPEAEQAVIDVNDWIRDAFDDLSMAAECVVSRSVNQPSGHRVEVDVKNYAIKIALLVDRFRLVAGSATGPRCVSALG